MGIAPPRKEEKKRTKENEEARQALLKMVKNNEAYRAALFIVHTAIFRGIKREGATDEDIPRCLDDLVEGLPSPFGRIAGNLISETAHSLEEVGKIRIIASLMHESGLEISDITTERPKAES